MYVIIICLACAIQLYEYHDASRVCAGGRAVSSNMNSVRIKIITVIPKLLSRVIAGNIISNVFDLCLVTFPYNSHV